MQVSQSLKNSPQCHPSGWYNQESKSQQMGTRVRLPITPRILLKLKEHWTLCKSEAGIVMLWVAFFGFFIPREITVPSLTSFNTSKHLALGDIALDSIDNPQTLSSPKDVDDRSTRKGCGCVYWQDRLFPAYSSRYAPLHSDTRSNSWSIFVFKSGASLTKSAFTARIREALQTLGFPEENFAGHSFRIRAATTAASARIEDSIIRTLGRWSSSAFLAYICTPREQLAALSRSLAT